VAKSPKERNAALKKGIDFPTLWFQISKLNISRERSNLALSSHLLGNQKNLCKPWLILLVLL